MSAGAINFQVAKQVPIARVLAHYGVQLHGTGGELRGQCPLLEHTSRESHNSFSVNTVRNVWCCQSQSCIHARDGELGGTVAGPGGEGGAMFDPGGRRQTDRMVRPRRGSPSTGAGAFGFPNEPSAPLSTQRPRSLPFLPGEPWHHALTAKTLGIGHYGGPGIMQGRVAIPVHNANHELVAYAGRSVEGEDPKYRFPPGFHKSQELFLLHRARHSGNDAVIVVEGFFDAAKVWQAGYRNVVALMGSSLSDTQAGLLQKHFQQAVLLLDGDTAGQSATAVISRRLAQIMNVEAIHLRAGVQPDQLASREMKAALFGHLRPRRCLER